MTFWHKLKFNTQQIEYETDKAVLIKMPMKSRFKGWAFWHPSKLVRDAGGNGYFATFSYTDDWQFKLVRVNRNNKATMLADSEDMEIAFEAQQPDTRDSYLEVEEPQKINDEVEVEQSLLR